jgi:hypothetical protein
MDFICRLSECGRQLNSTLEQVMLEGSKLSVVSGGGARKERIVERECS